MDARITKQRLANMLSYDWLKIVGAIALAAVAFCVFFLMIATTPTAGQTFYVYAYDGLTGGMDFSRLNNEFENKNVFSYDILKTGSETFSNNGMYGGTVFTARRSAGEGRVMFVSDVRTTDEEGNVSSPLLGFLDRAGTEQENFGKFTEPKVFLGETETYLQRFFGDALSSEEPDGDATRSAFMERNGKDKRYRSAAKKEEGVLEEAMRLKKLREDYLFVKAAVGGGTLGYVTYTGFEEKEHVVGFSMKSLNLTSLVFYTVEEEGTEVKKNDDIALCIFNNGDREGDLKYETVNFLAYLLRTYGTQK